MLSGAQRAKHKQQRAAGDWYVETKRSVCGLFDAVRFTGPIHDPCCGRGMIPIVAREYGYTATGSDLTDRGFGTSGVDFRADWTPRKTLIFNPPGKGDADLFLLHALEVIERGEMALAGLWENWRFPAGEWVRSFAIVTTEPNALCAELHARMPVVLGPETWPAWLGEEPADASRLKAITGLVSVDIHAKGDNLLRCRDRVSSHLPH